MNIRILDELCMCYELEDSPEDFEYVEVDSDYDSPNTFVDEDGTTYEVEYVGSRDILEYDYFDDTLNFGFHIYGKPKKIEVKRERLFQVEEQDEKFLLSELVGVLNYRIRLNDNELIVYQDRFVFDRSALKEFIEIALLLNDKKDITVNYDAFNKTFYIETEEWRCFVSEYIYVRKGLDCINVKRMDITNSLDVKEFAVEFDICELSNKVKKVVKATPMHGKVNMFEFITLYSNCSANSICVSADETVKVVANSNVMVSNVDLRSINNPFEKDDYILLREDGQTFVRGTYPNMWKTINYVKNALINIDREEFIADIEYFNKVMQESNARNNSTLIFFVLSNDFALRYNRVKAVTLFMKNGIKTVEFNASERCLILTDEIGGLGLFMTETDGKICLKRDNTAKWLDALKNGKAFNKHVIVRRK